MKKDRRQKTEDRRLTEREVRHVAKLAQLTLTLLEVEKMQKQLSEVLDYIAVLNRVETKTVEPTSQVTGLENVLREDNKEKSLSQKEALSGAKNKHQGRFEVKAIFK